MAQVARIEPMALTLTLVARIAALTGGQDCATASGGRDCATASGGQDCATDL